MTESPYNRGNAWIQTATGGQFWPAAPRQEDVDIRDIAASLSKQCRFTGHCKRFYSVAEHSVHVAQWVQLKYGVWPLTAKALLHDASEAYLADIAAPIKPLLPEYKLLETPLQDVIFARFGLNEPGIPDEVKEADMRILFTERDQNMQTPPTPWQMELRPLPIMLQFWTPPRAEREFLKMFSRLFTE